MRSMASMVNALSDVLAQRLDAGIPTTRRRARAFTMKVVKLMDFTLHALHGLHGERSVRRSLHNELTRISDHTRTCQEPSP